jgi:hypothetical protein
LSSKSSGNRHGHLPYSVPRPPAKYLYPSTSTKTSHSPQSRSYPTSGFANESPQTRMRKSQTFPMSFDDAFVVTSDSEDLPPHQFIITSCMPNLRTRQVIHSEQIQQSDNDERTYRSERGGHHSSNHSLMKQAQKKPAPTSSDSDSHKHISKSPRKSKDHVSPRRVRIVDRQQDEDNEGRPASPSPSPLRQPPLSQKTTLDANTIEISSDSDAPPSRNKLPPLVFAKKRAQKKLADSKVHDPLKPLSVNKAQGGDDIIDLT